MWLIVAFDLPTHTKEERRRYTTYRKDLLSNGFTMMQYSLYGKCMPTMKSARAMENKLGPLTPEGGEAKFFLITDKQFGETKTFFGPIKQKKEKEPPKYEQLLLF